MTITVNTGKADSAKVLFSNGGSTATLTIVRGDPNTPKPSVEGMLSGEFSVSAMTKVHFSQGNLQYVGTWQFAKHQWDYFGDNQSDNHRDLFGWGTGDAPNKVSTDYKDYSTFVDWGINAITNGGNKTNLWRTLTKDEWNYLFYSRTNAATLFGLGSVNGINGTVLLPDNWTAPAGAPFTASTTKGLANQGTSYYDSSKNDHYVDNTYTAEQWSVMESTGAVFLPAAGTRWNMSIYYVGEGGTTGRLRMTAVTTHTSSAFIRMVFRWTISHAVMVNLSVWYVSFNQNPSS